MPFDPLKPANPAVTKDVLVAQSLQLADQIVQQFYQSLRATYAKLVTALNGNPVQGIAPADVLAAFDARPDGYMKAADLLAVLGRMKGHLNLASPGAVDDAIAAWVMAPPPAATK